MTTAVLINHVAAYAAAVRRHLGDLSPEQVEDLTDGLEADLAEALDDPARPVTGEIPVATGATVDSAPSSGDAPTEKLPVAGSAATSVLDLTARFGTPEAYAEELRSAAGLPPALPAGSHRRRVPFARTRARSDALVAGIVSHRRWPAVRDFLVSLRPVWWVARGWALFFVVAGVLGIPFGLWPSGFLAFLAFVTVLVASVQHGRGVWSPPERFAGTVRVIDVLAIVVLPFAVGAAGPDDGYVSEASVVEPSPVADGVYLDGEPVENLFVYGPDGLPVDGARIVDAELRPVVVGRAGGVYDDEDGSSRFWEPREDEQGREVWNAYPLATWSIDGGDWTHPDGTDLPEDQDAVVPAPPVAQLSPLVLLPPASSGADPAPTEPGVDPSAPSDPAAVPPADPAADPGAVSAPDPAVPAVP